MQTHQSLAQSMHPETSQASTSSCSIDDSISAVLNMRSSPIPAPPTRPKKAPKERKPVELRKTAREERDLLLNYPNDENPGVHTQPSLSKIAKQILAHQNQIQQNSVQMIPSPRVQFSDAKSITITAVVNKRGYPMPNSNVPVKKTRNETKKAVGLILEKARIQEELRKAKEQPETTTRDLVMQIQRIQSELNKPEEAKKSFLIPVVSSEVKRDPNDTRKAVNLILAQTKVEEQIVQSSPPDFDSVERSITAVLNRKNSPIPELPEMKDPIHTVRAVEAILARAKIEQEFQNFEREKLQNWSAQAPQVSQAPPKTNRPKYYDVPKRNPISYNTPDLTSLMKNPENTRKSVNALVEEAKREKQRMLRNERIEQMLRMDAEQAKMDNMKEEIEDDPSTPIEDEPETNPEDTSGASTSGCSIDESINAVLNKSGPSRHPPLDITQGERTREVMLTEVSLVEECRTMAAEKNRKRLELLLNIKEDKPNTLPDGFRILTTKTDPCVWKHVRRTCEEVSQILPISPEEYCRSKGVLHDIDFYLEFRELINREMVENPCPAEIGIYEVLRFPCLEPALHGRFSKKLARLRGQPSPPPRTRRPASKEGRVEEEEFMDDPDEIESEDPNEPSTSEQFDDCKPDILSLATAKLDSLSPTPPPEEEDDKQTLTTSLEELKEDADDFPIEIVKQEVGEEDT